MGVMGEDLAHQVLRDLRQNRRCRNRCAERDGMGDRAEIGKAYSNCYRPAAQGFGPKPAADPVSEMAQRRPKDGFLSRLLADRRLSAGRSRPALGLDFTRV